MNEIAIPEHEARRQAILMQEMKRDAIFSAAEDIGVVIPEASPVDLWPLFLIRGLLNRVRALEEEVHGQEET